MIKDGVNVAPVEYNLQCRVINEVCGARVISTGIDQWGHVTVAFDNGIVLALHNNWAIHKYNDPEEFAKATFTGLPEAKA